MIYLLHPDGTIAACETEKSAVRREARGYERVEAWRFVYYWSLRDVRDYARLRSSLPLQERGRDAKSCVCTGHHAPERLPGGWARYYPDANE